MLVQNAFGVAGAEILVEEYMEGEELSVMAFTDGTNMLPLIPAQDHKRLLDGDEGPNTGGMGAYAPVTLSDPREGTPEHTSKSHRRLRERIAQEIMLPTLAALRERGALFRGVLYAGIMVTPDGPKVVEFNARFGDPEAQTILPLTDYPMFEVMAMVAGGSYLPPMPGRSELRGASASTVLASEGYPQQPRTGDRIDLPPEEDGVIVFHSGTARDAQGNLVTAGGRVLTVTAVADSLAKACERTTNFAERVQFAGKHFRRDIGWRELSRRARTS
jgi:phosphoribosylamine--glycine ligase